MTEDTLPAELRANARLMESQGLIGLAQAFDAAAARLEAVETHVKVNAHLQGQLDAVKELLREALVYAPRRPLFQAESEKQARRWGKLSDLGGRIEAKLVELDGTSRTE